MRRLLDGRTWRRWLAGTPSAAAETHTGSRQLRVFEASHAIVRVFYAVLLFLLLEHTSVWTRWLGKDFTEVLWPVAWMRLVGTPAVVHTTMLLSLLGAGACLAFPGRRWIRICLFLGLLQYVALTYSGVNIKHHWHGWLWVSFCFIFLPDGDHRSLSRSRARRQMHLGVVFAAQAALGLFYTLSGGFKLALVAAQAVIGDVHGLHPHAMAYQLAGYLSHHSHGGMLDRFFIEHPLLGFPAYQIAIYLELFCLAAVFRPSLHRVWGLALIAFHFGNDLTLGIAFTRQLLLLGLLFVCSPFAPRDIRWRDVTHDLPLIGWIARRLGS